MAMGLMLYRRVPTKATIKMMQLMINVYKSSVGDEKFSFVISTKAAEASRPTTAGRKPLNTASTTGCF